MKVGKTAFSHVYIANEPYNGNDTTTIKNDVKRLYSNVNAAKKEEAVVAELLGESGKRLLVAIKPANFRQFKQAIEKLNERLPEVAAYLVLRKDEGKGALDKALDAVKGFMPTELKTAMSIFNLEKLIKELEENADKYKIFDEEKIKAAIEAMKRAESVKPEKKDPKYLQGLAIAIASGKDVSDVKPTDELEKLLNTIKAEVVESSVIATKGITKAGMKIKEELGGKKLTGSINPLKLMNSLPILLRIQSAKTSGEKLRLLVKDFLGLSLTIKPAIFEEDGKYYPGTAIEMCEGTECDVVAIFAGNKESNKEWLEITTDLLR